MASRGTSGTTASRPLLPLLLLAATLFCSGVAVEITELRGPHMIQNGSETSVVLDCDYELSESEMGVVVKWFFNKEPEPVYQWIPSKQPQDLGVLKGRLDLLWTASDHKDKKHRALHIIRPTTELTGDYTCKVSTFDNEQLKSKRLVVFVPERSIELTETKSDDGKAVDIVCEAHGVFPEPTMKLLEGSESNFEEVSNVRVSLKENAGLFDISASKRFADQELQNTPTIFECELGIKDTEYKRKKNYIYYPDGYMGHRIELAEVQEVSSESVDENAAPVIHPSWLLLTLAAVTLIH